MIQSISFGWARLLVGKFPSSEQATIISNSAQKHNFANSSTECSSRHQGESESEEIWTNTTIYTIKKKQTLKMK